MILAHPAPACFGNPLFGSQEPPEVAQHQMHLAGNSVLWDSPPGPHPALARPQAGRRHWGRVPVIFPSLKCPRAALGSGGMAKRVIMSLPAGWLSPCHLPEPWFWAFSRAGWRQAARLTPSAGCRPATSTQTWSCPASAPRGRRPDGSRVPGKPRAGGNKGELPGDTQPRRGLRGSGTASPAPGWVLGMGAGAGELK